MAKHACTLAPAWHVSASKPLVRLAVFESPQCHALPSTLPASFSGAPPPWASASAAAVAARVHEALPKASPAVAAEYEALLADVAGGRPAPAGRNEQRAR